MSKRRMDAPSSKPRILPLGDALQPTIDRLKGIAAQASDALLAEGPGQPDHQLLDLCGDALHLLKQAQSVHTQRDAVWATRLRREWTDHDRARDDELCEQGRRFEAQASQLLRRAKKIRATTAAGIYAKALIVRASACGAPLLAMSLAEDLIDCPGLRQSLWPAETAEASS